MKFDAILFALLESKTLMKTFQDKVPFKSILRSELHPRLYLVQIPYMIIFHTYSHIGLTKLNTISRSARRLFIKRFLEVQLNLLFISFLITQ